jgi:hypothetical protein
MAPGELGRCAGASLGLWGAQLEASIMIHSPTLLRWSLLALVFGASCTGSIHDGDKPGGGGTSPPDRPGGGQTGNMTGGGAGAGGTSMPGVDEKPKPPAAGCGLSPRRIWALTPEQYARTVQALFPAAKLGDGLGGSLAVQEGFSNQAGRLDMTEPHVAQLLAISWQLAADAAADPAKLAPCLAQPTVDAACVRTFIGDFAARAFRRDQAPGEIDPMVTNFQKQAGDVRFAIQQLLTALLTSPNFVYRTELGPETATAGKPVILTSFEKASALSYFLTDGPPDAMLLAAARGKALETPAQIEAHTRRLLAGPASAAGLVKFFHEGFVLDEVNATVKDPMLFPQWKAQLATDLAGESDAFVKQVLWGEDAKLSTLLTANFSMLNGRLATFYGTGDTAAGEQWKKTTWRAGERAGLLTQAGPMATFAKENDTDVVGRGKFIRELLLCQPLPPPPANVNAVPPPPDGKHTQRERLAQHSADASCAGCHSLMDPLGLAFERYDGIGKHRTTDVGQMLDTSGKLTGAAPEGAPFKDAVELMGLLASSPTVKKCFIETAFRYANGREASGLDACTLQRLDTRFGASGGDMIDLAVAMTTDETFFQRGNP